LDGRERGEPGMQSTLAWIWAPLALCAVCFGLGLLTEAATRMRLAGTLLSPVGFCLGILYVDTVYRVGATTSFALPLLLVLALAGYGLQRTTILERLRPGAAAMAGTATYVLYMAPVALSGSWTWAGYNYTNDPANTMTTTAWILGHGFQQPPPDSSTSAIVAGDFIHQGYPLGAHLLMGTIRPLTGAPLMAIYQPFIAFAAAMATLAFVELARRVGLRPLAAAAAAVVASGASLLYVYGQLGGLKEIATVSAVATATGVAAQRQPLEWTWSTAAAVAVPLAALVPVLSAGGIAYAGLFALFLIAIVVGARRFSRVRGTQPLRQLVRTGLLGAALFLLLSAPSLADALRFGSTVNDQLSGSVLGQLLRPLPLAQVGGIWWAEDWRLPVAAGIRRDVNQISLALVFVFATIGVVWALRRRGGAALAGLVAVAAAVAILGPRTSPYGESKLYVILSPFLLLAAGIGVWALFSRQRAAGVVVAAFLAAGVVYSDAIAYREVRLAPVDRMEAMEDVAKAAKGHGLILHAEFEEWAKYFYRDARVDSPGEVWFGPHPWELRTGSARVAIHYDLDAAQLWYVNSFPAIVTRRAPDASRPPASFHRAYQNRYYQLWLRDTHSTAWLRNARTGVIHHLPLQGTMTSQARPRCSTILRFARQATPGQSLVAAHSPDNVVLDPTRARRSPGWPPSPTLAQTIVPITPGRAEASRFVPGGKYRVWVYGSSGRPISAYVDGRRVGTFKQVNTPGQWNDVGFVSLARGRHQLAIERPGGSFAPGDGFQGRIGPLALQPLASETLERVRPDEARALCGKNLDWVEIVQTGGPRD
jgi:hypothetical protein